MAKQIEIATFADETVLVLRDMEVGVQPYATHFRGRDGEHYWGHYFEREVDAREDFEERVVKQARRSRRV